jgi:hypothetical protein
MRARIPIAWALLAAVAIGVEVWLLVARRSGEVAYQPSSAVVAPSLEIAGANDLTQTFVPGADGLAAVSFVPLLASGPPQGPIDLELDAEGSDVAMAKRRLRPDELADRTPFTWEVPRVENAAGRHFTLRISAPDAPAGHGLHVAVGPPDYLWGTLRAGGRAQWGDLVFETRATRVHVLDVLRQWRRQTPGVLGTDAALVTILLALNLAAGAVIWHLASPSSPEAEELQGD